MTRTDLRTKLLADTILGTDTAFDLIEEIAAIPGVKWSHAPCIGLRGSIRGAVAPMAERIRGADPETEEPFESGAFPISRSRAHTHRRHGHPLQTVPSAGLIERPQEKNRVDALR